MDLLTFAATAVFSTESEEDAAIPLTPIKGVHSVLGEVTNIINISPEKFTNSPLQNLFTAPTLNTPTTKSRCLASNFSTTRSRSTLEKSSNGKLLSYSSPETGGGAQNRGVSSPYQPSNGSQGRSPLTPMSNLKLLTRIASMEESLTSKKVLFQNQSISDKESQCSSNVEFLAASNATTKNVSFRRHNSECLGQSPRHLTRSTSTFRKHPTNTDYPRLSSPGNLVTENMGNLPSVDETTCNRSSEGSRKDKSLGVLSEKFLEHFPMEVSFLETPRRLVIDEVALMLGTERRRVYDIINVLESLSMAARVQKNMYHWMGKLHLQETLARLKALGLKLDVGTHLQALQHLDNDFKFPKCIKTNSGGDGEKVDTRREKSLGILCQKFLMLLLVSPQPHIISLESAVRILIGEVGEDGERLRTRGRRLYDIANVLTSLGLVRKVPTAKAFQYVGPAVEVTDSHDDTLGVLQRHSLLPSCLGNFGGKENINSLGDHDVTPSNIAQRVQKRGRPRKLSADFSASTLPAAKRPKIQRTRSEDAVTSKQSTKFARHPSLHDICQVAEVEREKLLQKECLLRSHSNNEVPSYTSSGLFTLEKTKMPVTKGELKAIGPSHNSVISLQRRLMSRTKIPAALTFQGTSANANNIGKCSAQAKDEQGSVALSNVVGQDGDQTSFSYRQTLQEYRAFQDDARKITTSSLSLPNTKVCASSQNLNASARVTVIGGSSTHSGPQLGSGGPCTPAGSKSMQVIKVITRTGGVSQKESSAVITVLPTVQMCSQSTDTSKPAMHVNRGFQQLSTGIYSNGQKLIGSNDPMVDRVTHDSRQNIYSPYTIYTISNNHVGQRAFGGISSAQNTTVTYPLRYSTPPPCDNFSGDHMSRPSLTGLGNQVPLNAGHLHPNVITGPNSLTGCDQTSRWQPSPGTSSTDSELEEIFGNSFNFTCPRNVVCRYTSQNEGVANKEQV
nr:uncharacterized protein LOC123767697 [Procambarus clarkii]XP_045613555.1 uncharacterized protein LOC123767697 [Procambarus clarkii]XP_045613556.1 uncharacterized protein LOC123767697 [Procambarus clarkii]XP_045613557.1 uncharacterized protein LOC123767697 [Procambarus clarkii]XP_045613558.1 uncharacterized protein LOC123767697 [Procambarus clarkii]XP_045613559.1 uncharacterized protein LOC123767697 [Procambarus clarkii]XP_045613560.1 uncharacterized protein LOC123767697 [Procambarus clarki